MRDDRSALRRHSLIVEREGAEPRTMLLPRVRDDVHQIAAVAQLSQLVERKKGRAREIRFHPQHAVQFDRMSDRLVDLQTQLRAIENNGERTFRTLIGLVQRDCFFGDAPRVLDQFQFFDQFVAFVLPLSAKRIRIRTLHDVGAGKGVRGVPGAR